MNTPRLLALFLLAILAQGASATTIWLKDNNGQVCKNNGNVIGLGSVTTGGALTLTIDNPANGTVTPATGACNNLPRTTNPLQFSGSVTPKIVPVHMRKPGTSGALECLAQGSNFAGVAGVLTAGQGTIYQLDLGFSYEDGCVRGDLPSFVRPALIKLVNGEGPAFQGAYHIFNENNVPEPGSLYLFLAGFAGLTLLALQRRRSRKPSLS